ncbi:MAG: hypothetical protein KAU01_03950 [Candidatus Cloacimonetes bacterium]|nr:hypothetical protein [Candidatus Cloacimonadota bacterium]
MSKTNDLFSDLNFSDQEKIECSFNKIAEKILNNYLLKINCNEYRITEIEFYYNDECCNNYHPDPYTHRHYRQRLNAQWYFHRKGRGGLDITFGKGKNCKVYGGILIRAIEKYNQNKTNENDNYSEGPCKVVEKIFEVIKSKEDKNRLKKIIKGKRVFNKNNILHLDKNDILHLDKKNIDSQNEIAVYKAPRVGLQPNIDKPEWDKYIMKNYRYFVQHTNLCNYPSKDRELIFLSILFKKNKCKKKRESIKKLYNNIKIPTIKKYKTYYKDGEKLRKGGKKDEIEKFINETYTDFGVKNRCKLYGLLNEGVQNESR